MEISDYELLLDSLQMAGVYVIRKDNHQILYFNQWMKKTVPDLVLGAVRHELWVDMLPEGRTEMKNENINDAHPWKGTVRIEAADVLWEKKIPASVVTVIPCKESTAGKKEREYIGKSLGNLFFAIYDIDLEEDVFHTVNQREEVKNILGTEMSFTEAIRIYSEHFVHSDCREEYVQKMSRTNLLEKLSESRPFVAMEYHRIKIDAEGVPEGDGWVRATVIATEFRDGKSSKALYVAQDISEVKKKEEMEHQMLKEACEAANRANASKSEFLSRMSHDIRTPMNAITGFLRLLDKQQEDGAKRKEYIRKIGDASEILLSILNNVLEMTKIESGKAALDEAVWDMGQICDSLYSLFAAQMQAKNITFEKNVDIQHHFVWCDTTKVHEIYSNILNNAYKYTSEGGKVSMHLTEIPSAQEGYASFQIEIEDNGIGISKDFMPHLFEDFSREHNTTHSKVAGTGLGMSIAKKLSEQMGGSIAVESELGKGTKFTVIMAFRIASETDFASRETEEETAAVFTGKRILLAEDNDLNAEIAMEILSAMGLEVERAEDGAVCIDKVEQAEEGYYDLILMDIQMPHVNGYQAAEAIRKMDCLSKASIPIAAMTANAFEDDKQNAYAAGMDAHLAKPIDLQKLMEALAELL